MTATAAEDAPEIYGVTEIPPGHIRELAALYAHAGYQTPGEQLFALLCDVAALYTAGQRTEGVPLGVTLEGVLESVREGADFGD